MNLTFGAAFPNTAEAFDGRQRQPIKIFAAFRPVQRIQHVSKAMLIDKRVIRYCNRLDTVDARRERNDPKWYPQMTPFDQLTMQFQSCLDLVCQIILALCVFPDLWPLYEIE